MLKTWLLGLPRRYKRILQVLADVGLCGCLCGWRFGCVLVLRRRLWRCRRIWLLWAAPRHYRGGGVYSAGDVPRGGTLFGQGSADYHCQGGVGVGAVAGGDYLPV